MSEGAAPVVGGQGEPVPSTGSEAASEVGEVPHAPFRDETDRAVWLAGTEHPGATTKELVARTGVPRATLQRRLVSAPLRNSLKAPR